TARYRTFHHMDIRTLPGRDRRYRCIPLDHRPIPAFPGPVRTARHNSRASPYPTSSTPLDEQSSSDVEGEVSATQHAHPAVPPVIGTVAGHSAPQAGGNEASSSQSSAVSLPGRHRRQPASMAVDDSYPLEDLIDALDKLEWDNTQSASVKDWIARQVDMTLNPARKFSKQSEHSVRKICEEVGYIIPLEDLLS
ncbi:hypothetical protein EV122DRAFT_181741, partial [Schizophyllum commune]